MGKDYSRPWSPEELRADKYIPENEALALLGLTKGKDFDWFHYDYIDSYQNGADGQTWVLLLPKVAAKLRITPSPSSPESLPSLPHAPKIQNPKSKVQNRKSDWMTQQEARDYLGVSRNTLHSWMQSGILRFANTRPRLVLREDVERRAEEDWFAELHAHQDRIRRPKMRPYRRDGVPLVSDEAFQLCAPYGYMAVAQEERKVAEWREMFGRGSYDYAKKADWVDDLMDEKRVMRGDEAMALLRISRGALFSLVRRGKLVRTVVCRGFGKRQAYFSRDQVEGLADERKVRESRRSKTPAEWAHDMMHPHIRTSIEAPPGDRLITRQEAAAILGVSLIRVSELVKQGRLFGWQQQPGKSGSRLRLSSNQVARYAASWDRVRRRAWRDGTAIPGVHTQERMPGLLTQTELFIDEHRLDEAGTKNLDRDHGEYFSTPQVARELEISCCAIVRLRKRGVLLGHHLRKRYGPGNPWWFYLKEDVWALKHDPEYAERSMRAKEFKRKR